MNPGGPKSGAGTESSVSELVDKETSELLEVVKADGSFGKRRQEALKALSFKRGGRAYLLTSTKSKPLFPKGVKPGLAHIIPNSIHSPTLKVFAGTARTF